MRLFIRFIALPGLERIAVVEAVLSLMLGRLLLLLPFRRIAPFLGQKQHISNPVSTSLGADERAAALVVRRALLRVAGRLPWHSSCLVCALAARIMLHRRHVPSVLHLGARSDAETALAAHAWLSCGDVDVIGAETSGEYTPIVAFKA